jgi:hypothetical protein
MNVKNGELTDLILNSKDSRFQAFYWELHNEITFRCTIKGVPLIRSTLNSILKDPSVYFAFLAFFMFFKNKIQF